MTLITTRGEGQLANTRVIERSQDWPKTVWILVAHEDGSENFVAIEKAAFYGPDAAQHIYNLVRQAIRKPV